MKTKKEILIKNGFELMIGYTLGYEKDPDYNNVFISREDVEKFYNLKPIKYYWRDGFEYIMDEEQAWEDFYDSFCSNNDLDIGIDEFDRRMLQ